MYITGIAEDTVIMILKTGDPLNTFLQNLPDSIPIELLRLHLKNGIEEAAMKIATTLGKDHPGIMITGRRIAKFCIYVVHVRVIF